MQRKQHERKQGALWWLQTLEDFHHLISNQCYLLSESSFLTKQELLELAKQGANYQGMLY